MGKRSSWYWRARGVMAAAVPCAIALAAPASAAPKSFTVTSTSDHAPGACTKPDCTLREAISAANSHPGADSVLLAGGTTYKLSIPGRGEDLNATGDLDVTGPLTITSAGSRLATIDAQRIDRVIDAHARLSVAKLIIRGGETTPDIQNECGCGIRSEVNAPLTVTDSKIVANKGLDTGVGGGIYKSGNANLTVTGATVHGNSAGLAGGGIFDESSPPARVLISHSRLTDNTAGYAGGFDEFGDGIQVRIDHSTIARNHATDPNQGAEGGRHLDRPQLTHRQQQHGGRQHRQGARWRDLHPQEQYPGDPIDGQRQPRGRIASGTPRRRRDRQRRQRPRELEPRRRARQSQAIREPGSTVEGSRTRPRTGRARASLSTARSLATARRTSRAGLTTSCPIGHRDGVILRRRYRRQQQRRRQRQKRDGPGRRPVAGNWRRSLLGRQQPDREKQGSERSRTLRAPVRLRRPQPAHLHGRLQRLLGHRGLRQRHARSSACSETTADRPRPFRS